MVVVEEETLTLNKQENLVDQVVVQQVMLLVALVQLIKVLMVVQVVEVAEVELVKLVTPMDQIKVVME